MAKYDALDLSHDATEFANSKFGAHYLNRLKRLRDEHLAVAMSDDYNDSFRAHRASKAAALDAEIEFFTIARTIQKTPSLLQRLKKKLEGGESSNDV